MRWVLLVGLCQSMHTTVIIMFQVYKQATLYESSSAKDIFFVMILLLSKALGGFIASQDTFRDRQKQMQMTSLLAGAGLLIMLF